MTARRDDPGGDESHVPWLSPRDLAVAVLLVAAVGAVAFWKLDRSDACGAHPFVNPGVACLHETAITADVYAGLEHEIRAFIDNRRAAGVVERASVFVRALHDGPTLSIDEYRVFTPASLLKLPVVLAFFRFDEDEPRLLSKPLLYARSQVTHFAIPDAVEVSKTELREGESYSIEKLMRNTIAHSDNLAYYLLLEHANFVVPDGEQRMKRIFQELGVIDPRSMSDETIGAREYARLFRLLYNASFLNVERSEKVLSWLVESRYDKGLAAGVPDDVRVGNKFGERALPGGSKQLHDCGIVFFPKHPYTLCVMTRGKDFDELRAVIRQISRMVYDETREHAGADGEGRGKTGLLRS